MVININELLQRNHQLLDKYPFLWPVQEGAKLPLEAFKYSATQLDRMPRGYQMAFAQKLFDEILECVKRSGSAVDSFYLVKFEFRGGRMNICGNLDIPGIQDVFDKYEYLSERTCSDCGSKAEYRSCVTGLPHCERCMARMMLERGQNKISGEFTRIQFPEWRSGDGERVFTGTSWVSVSAIDTMSGI